MAWPDISIFLGPLAEATTHAHGAWAWCVGLEGELQFASADTESRGRAFSIEPGHTHRLHGGNKPVAVVYFSPELARGLKQGRIEHPARLVTLLNDAYRSKQVPNIETALLRERAALASTAEAADARVRRTAATIRSDLARDVRLAELAAHERLSGERLRHLFRAHTGVTLRRYRLWHRCIEAVTAAVRGQSLTEAAYGVGFSSSAHLSSTFRAGFGLAPSQIVRAPGLEFAQFEPAET